MTVQLAGAVVASPTSHRVTTFGDQQGKIVLSTAKKLVHNDSWGKLVSFAFLGFAGGEGTRKTDDAWRNRSAADFHIWP
jgi:hypothetical protein